MNKYDSSDLFAIGCNGGNDTILVLFNFQHFEFAIASLGRRSVQKKLIKMRQNSFTIKHLPLSKEIAITARFVVFLVGMV